MPKKKKTKQQKQPEAPKVNTTPQQVNLQANNQFCSVLHATFFTPGQCDAIMKEVVEELWMSGERGFMWSIYARDGLYKALNNNASPTCKYGISSYMGETFNKELSNQMQKVINSIKDGSFAKNLDKEEEKNYKQVKEFFNEKNNSLISKVEKETKNILGEYL